MSDKKDIVKLTIHSRIGGRDHCSVTAVVDDLRRQVGFIGLREGAKICVQRCGSCGKENYMAAVSDGVCSWCGWDANDRSMAEVEVDLRK
jgi:ribosomal protein L37E